MSESAIRKLYKGEMTPKKSEKIKELNRILNIKE